MNVQQAIEAVVVTLMEMDRESPYGLRGYRDYLVEQGHTEFDTRGVQDEVPITWDLANRLSAREIPTECEQCYTGSGEECDIVLGMEGGPMWLEGKVVYTTWFDAHENKRRATNINRKLHEVVHDWNKKLCRLTYPEVGCIAALLLGFQTKDDQIGSTLIENRVEVALLKPWQKKEAQWDTRQPCRPHVPFETKLWLWYRLFQ